MGAGHILDEQIIKETLMSSTIMANGCPNPTIKYVYCDFGRSNKAFYSAHPCDHERYYVSSSSSSITDTVEVGSDSKSDTGTDFASALHHTERIMHEKQ